VTVDPIDPVQLSASVDTRPNSVSIDVSTIIPSNYSLLVQLAPFRMQPLQPPQPPQLPQPQRAVGLLKKHDVRPRPSLRSH
jgi:hypothetical protein